LANLMVDLPLAGTIVGIRGRGEDIASRRRMIRRVHRSKSCDDVRQIAAVVAVGASLGGVLFAAGEYVAAPPPGGRLAIAAGAPAIRAAAAGTAVGDDTI